MAPSKSSRNLILDQLRIVSEQVLQLMQRIERLEHLISANECRHRGCRIARQRALEQVIVAFTEDLEEMSARSPEPSE
ncbi:MAG: hypothetical protein WC683_07190 [bacterium]